MGEWNGLGESLTEEFVSRRKSKVSLKEEGVGRVSAVKPEVNVYGRKSFRVAILVCGLSGKWL